MKPKKAIVISTGDLASKIDKIAYENILKMAQEDPDNLYDYITFLTQVTLEQAFKSITNEYKVEAIVTHSIATCRLVLLTDEYIFADTFRSTAEDIVYYNIDMLYDKDELQVNMA